MLTTNVMRILSKHKIPYEPFYYKVDMNSLDGISVAKELNEDPSYVFKTLVCESQTHHYYVFLINVEHELDLKKCAKIVNEKSLSLAPLKMLESITGGYVRGGTSPIGMKKQYKTIIDVEAMNKENIYISGGLRGTQVKLNPQKLAELIQASFKEIK